MELVDKGEHYRNDEASAAGMSRNDRSQGWWARSKGHGIPGRWNWMPATKAKALNLCTSVLAGLNSLPGLKRLRKSVHG